MNESYIKLIRLNFKIGVLNYNFKRYVYDLKHIILYVS